VDIGVVGSRESDTRQNGNDGIHRANIQLSFENVQTSGILVEQNMNSPMFSTSGNNSYQTCSMAYSPLTPKTLFGRRSETPAKRADHKGTMKSTSGIVQSPCIDSPNLCEKKQDSKSNFFVSSCQTTILPSEFACNSGPTHGAAVSVGNMRTCMCTEENMEHARSNIFLSQLIQRVESQVIIYLSICYY
jgi:hypothetical protein